ncbi:MAG: phosphopyruvate hydratase [Lachnospira sp.]|nr:phosphopyruvate hydratase [Lachnospira sp.]
MEICISKIHAREVLDSRGNPTVEAEVVLCDGTMGFGIAPSGASTGAYEALELRDNNPGRYNKKGVLLAVGNINTEINALLNGVNIFDQRKIDRIMTDADGTPTKSRFGANAILAVSIACAQAAAKALKIELFQYLGGFMGGDIPIPMMNILNGGAHANSSVDIQEFMIVPVGIDTCIERVRACCEVYHALKEILNERGLSTAVGDEGGFAPNLEKDEDAIELILEAISRTGYDTKNDFKIAIDAAASEWYKDGYYILPKKNHHYSTTELISYWKNLIERYPIISIEDPLAEEDWEGWQTLTETIGKRTMLVGDDLFVTNTVRLLKGINTHCANAILIKPNQIGTLTETIEAIKLARANNYNIIMSHRSGETEDTTIADMAAGFALSYIKTGAPARGERTAKYNRLLRIEEAIGQYR